MGNVDKILVLILGVSAIIGVAIWLGSDWLTPKIADPMHQGWIGFVGLYLTLFGLALAGHQLWKVRSATEAAAKASTDLLSHVRSTSRLFEIGELKREILLLKTNIEAKSLDAALQSLDAVRNRLGLLSELVKISDVSSADFATHSAMLDETESTLRKAKAAGVDLPDSVQMVLNIGIMQRAIADRAAKLSLQSRTASHE